MQKSKDQVRLYYTTPQVCDLLEVDAKFLVQMEKEFPEIRFEKNGAGKKVYRRKYFLLLMIVVQFLKDGLDHDLIKNQLLLAPKKDLEDWAFGLIEPTSSTKESELPSQSTAIMSSSEGSTSSQLVTEAPATVMPVASSLEIHTLKSEILEIIQILKR